MGIFTAGDLWQGGEDRTVPPSMGEYIAEQLPACQYRFVSSEGHFSLAIDHGAEFLEILRNSLITEKSFVKL
jgi:pimeloyl-ACP methyl ester carboxylesterase